MGGDHPYHHPVSVLTQDPRPSQPMEGGTTSSPGHRGREAAGGNDVRIVGGAATVQQYLRAGLIDDLHVVVVPILL